jgi:hypothetical protein
MNFIDCTIKQLPCNTIKHHSPTESMKVLSVDGQLIYCPDQSTFFGHVLQGGMPLIVMVVAKQEEPVTTGEFVLCEELNQIGIVEAKLPNGKYTVLLDNCFEQLAPTQFRKVMGTNFDKLLVPRIPCHVLQAYVKSQGKTNQLKVVNGVTANGAILIADLKSDLVV